MDARCFQDVSKMDARCPSWKHLAVQDTIVFCMIIFPLARRDPTVQVADPARDPLRTAWTPASALPIWEQIERSGKMRCML